MYAANNIKSFVRPAVELCILQIRFEGQQEPVMTICHLTSEAIGVVYQWLESLEEQGLVVSKITEVNVTSRSVNFRRGAFMMHRGAVVTCMDFDGLVVD